MARQTRKSRDVRLGPRPRIPAPVPPGLIRPGRVLAGVALLLLLLLLVGAPGGAAAAEPPPAEAWAALRTEAVGRLHELAAWCTSAKLFRARAEVYEAVLLFEPDDEEARHWLRYRRKQDGSWVKKPGATTPRDMSRSREAFETRRDDWRRSFAERAKALIEAARMTDDVRLGNDVLRLAARLAPDDEGLREANDEVRTPKDGTSTWILRESETALSRRREIRGAARMAVAKAGKPQGGQPTSADGASDVAWGPVLQGAHVRTLGTPPAEEMEKQHLFCEATWPFFQSVFGLEPPAWSDASRYGRGVSVYVFDSLEAGNAFLSKHGHMSERDLSFVAPLVGSWIPGRTAVVVKTPLAVARLEAGPKMLLSAMCRTLFGIQGRRAWAAEGLSHYLVYPLVGTRFIGSVRDQQGRYGKPRPGPPEYERNTPTGDDWLRAGLALIQSEEKPDLPLLAGKDVNTISPPEVLYGYCLVAYLIEGWPDRCVAFFSEVGSSAEVDLDRTALRHLGMDLVTMEARVERWLEETTGAD